MFETWESPAFVPGFFCMCLAIHTQAGTSADLEKIRLGAEIHIPKQPCVANIIAIIHMDNLTGKLVLILEKSTTNLAPVTQTGEKYVLEGVFAEFGIENRNGRIYEESEYLSHLDEMQERIRKTNGVGFMGALDHPESFDVLAATASHLVEHLEYDKANRQVKGRIRLLTTPMGKVARALIDDGVQLSISSRAAGMVQEDKHVQIKKIFTYDIVADPGFENAQLTRVNENHELIGLNESLGLASASNVQVFDMSGSKTMGPSQGVRTPVSPKNTTKDMSKFITVEQFDDYVTRVLKPEFAKVTGVVESLRESASTPDNALAKKVATMEKFIQYLSEQTNTLVNYVEHVVENMRSFESADFSKLQTAVANLTRYTKYVAQTLDESIEHTNYLAEGMNGIAGYQNYLGEGLEKITDYSSNHLARKVDAAIQYGEHIHEHVNNVIGFADTLSEGLERVINENRQMRRSGSAKINEGSNATYNIRSGRKGDLTSQVDAILAEAKRNKVERVANDANYGFLRLLNENKRREFLALDTTKKQKVAQALTGQMVLSESDVVRVWDNAVTEHVNSPERWLAEMPDAIKPLWEAADQRLKDRIVAQATMYQFPNSYSIKEFWSTRDFGNTKPLEVLNESAAPVASAPTAVNPLGYDAAYLQVMQGSIASKFQK